MEHPSHIEELHETRSVAEANGLLRTGWALVTIVEARHGHTYILGARTALEVSAAASPSTLPTSPTPPPSSHPQLCPGAGHNPHA